MPSPRDPQLKLFAIELVNALNRGLKASAAAVAAGEAAGYPKGKGPKAAKTFAANCRKRAQHKDVRAHMAEQRRRQAEMVARAADGAVINAEYLVRKLDNLTNYNVDDYLMGVDKDGQRFIAITDDIPRDVLSRLAEVSSETDEAGVRKTRIKGYGLVEAIRLMAQIKGLMSADVHKLDVGDALMDVLKAVDGKTRGLPQRV